MTGILIATSVFAGFLYGPMGAAAVLLAAIAWIAGHVMVNRRNVAESTPIITEAPREDKLGSEGRFYSGMLSWILLAVGVRLFLVLLLNATSLWRSFAPDAYGWSLFGQQMLDYWNGRTPYPEDWLRTINTRTMYAALNAVSLSVFGTTRYPLSFINALVGIGAAAVFGRLAEEIWDGSVGRRAFLICMFFPSTMTWTCMSIREAWAYLAIGFLLLGAQMLRRQIAIIPVIMVVLTIPFIYTIRSYLVPLLVIAVVLSFAIVRIRQVPHALVGLSAFAVCVGLYGQELGITSQLASEEQLVRLHELRNGLAVGGSAYGMDVDTRTWYRTIMYLPEGFARFLFSPFPWAIQSWRQAITLPESVLWIALFYQAVRAIVRETRDNLPAISTPLFVCILTILAYAIVSGNEGTAYRHRAQMMNVLFMFSAAYQVRQTRVRIRTTEQAAQPRLVAT